MILKVHNIKKYFSPGENLFSRKTGVIKALDGVSFTVDKNDSLGIVGESGCGKSTLAKIILKLTQPTEGEVIFDEGIVNLRKDLQIIFQNPYTSLDPKMKIKDSILEGILIHKLTDKRNFSTKTTELLESVELDPHIKDRYPNEFSGGQLQRISIARAIATEPKILVLDEPVSSLDLPVQSKILKLLLNLKRDRSLTYIFISHNLSVIRQISTKVMVLYMGKVMEIAETNQIFKLPLHPYTYALMKILNEEDNILKDEPSYLNSTTGRCIFSNRCPFCQKKCLESEPSLEEKAKERLVRCYFPLS